jgi:hypothetical protein
MRSKEIEEFYNRIPYLNLLNKHLQNTPSEHKKRFILQILRDIDEVIEDPELYFSKYNTPPIDHNCHQIS